jgi:hypothetical protein
MFNEAKNNKTPKEHSPNAQLLFNATAHDTKGLDADELELDKAMPEFEIINNPWEDLQAIKVDLRWDYNATDSRPLGFSAEDCPYMHCPFVVTQKDHKKPDPLLHHPKGYNRESFVKLMNGAYILKMNGIPTTWL